MAAAAYRLDKDSDGCHSEGKVPTPDNHVAVVLEDVLLVPADNRIDPADKRGYSVDRENHFVDKEPYFAYYHLVQNQD